MASFWPFRCVLEMELWKQQVKDTLLTIPSPMFSQFTAWEIYILGPLPAQNMKSKNGPENKR